MTDSKRVFDLAKELNISHNDIITFLANEGVKVASLMSEVDESNYQKIFDIKTLDAVIMFMPYESSFESLLDKTEDIILEANRCKVILASPSTLISVLKIIDNMWSINERNKNADLIASTAIEIYAQVEKVHSAFENAGNELQKSMSSVENAKFS